MIPRIAFLAALAACRFEPGKLADEAARDGASSDMTQGTSDALPDGPDIPLDAQTSFVIEAESSDFTSTADGVHMWTIETTLAGYSGTGYVSALPTTGSPCAVTDLFCGALSTYNFTVAVAGDYRVTIRHYSPNGCCDSVFWSIGLNVVTEDLDPDVATMWTDDTSTSVVNLPAGATSFNLRMREAGARIDQIRIDKQ